ncbi:hypothetical protein TNCV_3826891 [Trichonephila clavipes]|nr:hypothetical protein TNCV_3826891 [Trichonephila clavipes]
MGFHIIVLGVPQMYIEVLGFPGVESLKITKSEIHVNQLVAGLSWVGALAPSKTSRWENACDVSIHDPSTNPLGKTLGYQFVLLATKPAENMMGEIKFAVHSRSFLTRIKKSGSKPEIRQDCYGQRRIPPIGFGIKLTGEAYGDSHSTTVLCCNRVYLFNGSFLAGFFQ